MKRGLTLKVVLDNYHFGEWWARYSCGVLDIEMSNHVWTEGIVAHRAPGSQTHALLDEKARIAARLLDRGLTVSQISAQLRCSPHFVREVRKKELAEVTLSR